MISIRSGPRRAGQARVVFAQGCGRLVAADSTPVMPGSCIGLLELEKTPRSTRSWRTSAALVMVAEAELFRRDGDGSRILQRSGSSSAAT